MIDWNAPASDAKLLDLFAAHALSAMITADMLEPEGATMEVYAHAAYGIARTMMQVRYRQMNGGRFEAPR